MYSKEVLECCYPTIQTARHAGLQMQTGEMESRAMRARWVLQWAGTWSASYAHAVVERLLGIQWERFILWRMGQK